MQKTVKDLNIIPLPYTKEWKSRRHYPKGSMYRVLLIWQCPYSLVGSYQHKYRCHYKGIFTNIIEKSNMQHKVICHEPMILSVM